MWRILVVEDDPVARDAATEFLKTFDYEVNAAPSQHEALERMYRHPPDAVLLDLVTAATGARALVEECRRRRFGVADLLATVQALSAGRGRGGIASRPQFMRLRSSGADRSTTDGSGDGLRRE